MVEAGWHYCPTSESDDFVRCAYCDLSLDGWEPKDNPRWVIALLIMEGLAYSMQ